MGPLRQSLDPDPEPDRADGTVQVLDQGQELARRRLTASPSRAPQLHRFCQFDFPFTPGPADGRYLIRGEEDVADVIVLRTVGAELKRPGLGRRARKRPTQAEEGDAPEPVAVTRVTVVRGKAFDDAAAAQAWLARCRDAETASLEVDEALKLLNRAIHAHRIAAADPHAGDVSLGRARRVRLGYGTGDELVEGRWRDAYAVPQPVARRARRRMLAPEEQLAAILSGRRSAYPSEDLLLRARLDFDQDRFRTAALQANAAHAAFEAETQKEQAHRAELESLSHASLHRELDDDEAARLGDVLRELERAVRRRRHSSGVS